MAAVEHEDITLWLLSVLCFVVVMAGFMVFLVFQWRHRKTLPGAQEPDAAEDRLLILRSPPPPQFSVKRATTWLAVKSTSVQAVQSALSLHNPKPCSWAEGLSGDRVQSLFVSPPVAGWILVLGPALPDPADDIDGTVFAVTPSELADADRYEVADYTRVAARLASGIQAWVYVASPDARAGKFV